MVVFSTPVDTDEPPSSSSSSSASSSSPSSDVSRLLPDVVPKELLPKLPVKSLIRLKSVSKDFYSTISSPEFIKDQLEYSCSSKGKRLLVLGESGDRIVTYDLDDPFSSAIETFSWSTFGETEYTGYRFEGSCNGILCFWNNHDYDESKNDLLLLKPSTRLALPLQFAHPDENCYRFGFGYDKNSKAYKIVYFYPEYYYRGGQANTSITVVLSLKGGRHPLKMVRRGLIEATQPCVVIDGHLLHWKFDRPSKSESGICCFDVCTDEWRADMVLPAFHYDPSVKNYYLVEIGVTDGNLFSQYEDRGRPEYVAEIWVMKEYGVQASWLRLVSIPLSGYLRNGVSFLARRRCSPEFLLDDSHCKLLAYDPNREVNDNDGVIPQAGYELPERFYPVVCGTCHETIAEVPGSVLFTESDDESDENQMMSQMMNQMRIR